MAGLLVAEGAGRLQHVVEDLTVEEETLLRLTSVLSWQCEAHRLSSDLTRRILYFARLSLPVSLTLYSEDLSRLVVLVVLC